MTEDEQEACDLLQGTINDQARRLIDLSQRLSKVEAERDNMKAEKDQDAWHQGWQVAVRQRDAAERELAAIRADQERMREALKQVESIAVGAIADIARAALSGDHDAA